MPTATKSLFKSSSKLTVDARAKVTEALNSSLADGLDLYSQIKVAHWNLKGPHFAALHPLFDTLASNALENNDEIAERAVALGALAAGTVRTSAGRSRLAQYPEDVTRTWSTSSSYWIASTTTSTACAKRAPPARAWATPTRSTC